MWNFWNVEELSLRICKDKNSPKKGNIASLFVGNLVGNGKFVANAYMSLDLSRET